MKKAVIIWFIFLLTLLLLTSCAGTRKVDLQKSKEVVKNENELAIVDNTKIETKAESNVKKESKVETNSETGEVTRTTTIEPIDNTKPASVVNEDGTKTELNNSKKTTTETTTHSKQNKKEELSIDSKEKLNQKQQNGIKINAKTKDEASKEALGKKIDANKGNFWKWIILFVILAVVIWFVLWSRKFIKEKEKLNLKN